MTACFRFGCMRYFSLACSSHNCIANLLVSISLWVRQYNRSPVSPCKKPAIGGTYKNEFVTDQNGEIDLFGLEPGAYTMKELAAPSGYLVDAASHCANQPRRERAACVHRYL